MARLAVVLVTVVSQISMSALFPPDVNAQATDKRLHIEGVTLGTTGADVGRILTAKGWTQEGSGSAPMAFIKGERARRDVRSISLSYALDASGAGRPEQVREVRLLMPLAAGRDLKTVVPTIQEVFEEVAAVYGKPDACKPHTLYPPLDEHCTWTRQVDGTPETLHWQVFNTGAGLRLVPGPSPLAKTRSNEVAVAGKDPFLVAGVSVGMSGERIKGILEKAGFKEGPPVGSHSYFYRTERGGTDVVNVKYGADRTATSVRQGLGARHAIDYKADREKLTAEFGKPDSCVEPRRGVFGDKSVHPALGRALENAVSRPTCTWMREKGARCLRLMATWDPTPGRASYLMDLHMAKCAELRLPAR